VRFVALDFEEAEFEHAGVPALLAYKDGNKFADLVPLRDEVPFTCNVVTNLEEAMKRYVLHAWYCTVSFTDNETGTISSDEPGTAFGSSWRPL
jgi:hypothetical protein